MLAPFFPYKCSGQRCPIKVPARDTQSAKTKKGGETINGKNYNYYSCSNKSCPRALLHHGKSKTTYPTSLRVTSFLPLSSMPPYSYMSSLRQRDNSIKALLAKLTTKHLHLAPRGVSAWMAWDGLQEG
eukprot:1157913-Pelagomonas_calceolata.AAC.1